LKNDLILGYTDDKEGLIDIVDRNKTSHPKRAYLFIKCITNMIERGSLGFKVLSSHAELSRKWNSAIDWLNHELDRRGPGGSTYGYSTTSWSPPSNESSNGSFFLERSLSAKTTLDKAFELRIEAEQVHFIDSYEDV
jgi:ubiquitin carboxyl-terminal hydrolase 9/24